MSLRAETDVNSESLTYRWTVEDDAVVVAEPESRNTSIEIPYLTEEKVVTVTLTVCNEYGCNEESEDISLPVMTQCREWGLGATLNKEVSNDVDYEWYVDALTLGKNVYDSPCVSVMAAKWADETFDKTPQDFIADFPGVNNWWDLADIHSFLSNNGITRDYVEFTENNEIAMIVEAIDEGNIVILLMDMYYIEEQLNPNWRTGRFYSLNTNGFGLSVIVKGYKKVDSQIFFEVYDPLSMGVRYSDNTLVGKNRYFSEFDVLEALNQWSCSMTVVRKGN